MKHGTGVSAIAVRPGQRISAMPHLARDAVMETPPLLKAADLPATSIYLGLLDRFPVLVALRRHFYAGVAAFKECIRKHAPDHPMEKTS